MKVVYTLLLKLLQIIPSVLYIPLISRVRQVRTASYGPSFFPSFYGPSARAMKTRKEKMKIQNLPYGPSKRG